MLPNLPCCPVCHSACCHCTLFPFSPSSKTPNTNSTPFSLGLCPYLQTLLMVVSEFPIASYKQVCDDQTLAVGTGGQTGCNVKGSGMSASACWATAVPPRVPSAYTVGLGEGKHGSLNPLDIIPIKIFCCTEAHAVFFLTSCRGPRGRTFPVM